MPLKELTKKKPHLFVVFSPYCSACKTQIKKELSCLSDQVHISLLGAFDTERKLRKEHQNHFKKKKAFFADKKILNALGFKSSITPQSLLVIDNKNAFQFKGLTKCKNFLDKLPARKVKP